MRNFTPNLHAGLTALFLFLLQFSFAQTGNIVGKVSDEKGNPLSGATVAVQDQKNSVLTDATGNYFIKAAPGSYSLTATYVGHNAQTLQVTVTAGGSTAQDFTLALTSQLSEITVVGTRSRLQRSQLSTPVPVDVINAREIKNFAQTDVTQMLTYVAPSFQSARQTVTDGTDHIDPAGLRGLGPDQTLVLLNGKRRHNTALVNINGSVGRGSVGIDMNAIPAAAIERIEVLRDGAAAQYGSDAIAGVINIVLKNNYKGLNVSAMTGENFTNMPYNGGVKINDGLTTQFDLVGGIAGSKGYINVSGQWLKRDRTNRSGIDNIPLVYYGNAGAFPAAGTGAGGAAYTSPAGVAVADYRRWLIDLDKTKAQERKYDRHNVVAGNSAATNYGAFVNAGLNVGSNGLLYLTTGASQRDGSSYGFSRNPNSVSQLPVLANGRPYYPDGFLPEIGTTIKDFSTIAGFKTEFGGWNADLSNTLGQNTIYYNIHQTGNASLPPADNVQTDFYAGKLLFFQNTVNLDLSRGFTFANKSSLNVAFGGEYRYERFQIKQGEFTSYNNGGRSASIDPIPAYPNTTTPNTFVNVVPASGSQVFPGFQPADAIKANRSVYAGYVDLEYTVGKLLLGAAGRYESYAEKDDTYNGTGIKLTGKYDISRFLAVRGSYNTGFRAPSLHQRYFQNTSTQFVNSLPSQSLTANNYNPIVRNAFGINELKPEKSWSYTAGLVGKVGRNFTYTVDGYFIHINDRIVLSTPFNRSNPVVAAIFTANNVDASINALQFWTNAVNTETKGLDIVLTERVKLGPGNASFSLASNLTRTRVVGGIHTNSAIDAAVNNPGKTDNTKNPANDLSNILFDRQQRGRLESALPQSKFNLTVSYALKKWDFQVRAVRFGEVKYFNSVDPAAVQSNGTYWNDVGLGTDQTFSAKIITDLVVTYKVMTGLGVTIGATNLFDVYPDQVWVDPRNAPQAVYANPVAGANKAPGGYSAGRDASNRGRFLFPPSQFGFNGRFLFARLNVDIGQLVK
ncbi:MAG: TonB-dependent receptor [Williamsia sp.]|nr:TonB-dependent receptor [Williamsia sp.]